MKKLIQFLFLIIPCFSIAQLPVELSTFNVDSKDNYIILNYTTESEVDNDFFFIDVSLEKGEHLSSVKVQPNKEGRYNSLIKVVKSGNYLVRLSQVDRDGHLTELKSGVVSVKITDKPFTRRGKNLELLQREIVSVFDINGTKVMKLMTDNISLDNLPSGYYVVVISGRSSKIFLE